MAHKPARIDSPEVLKQFRRHYMTFDQAARNALMGCASEVSTTVEWLRTEQRLYWKNQLRKRDEELNKAQSEYAQAQWSGGRGELKSACVDELRALQRAKRRKEETEQKIAVLKKWTALLDQKISKMMGPVNALTILLDQSTPRINARLDQMLDSLDEYFKGVPTEEA